MRSERSAADGGEIRTIGARSGRREFLRTAALGGGILLSAAANTLLAGCGGGGRNNNGGTPNNGGNGSIDTATRLAALSAIETFTGGLGADLTAAQAREQVRNFLADRPEFSKTGFSDDGCVWATFKDGRQFIYIANRLRESNDGEGINAVRHISRAAGDSLPKSSKVYSLTGVGTYLSNCCETVGGWMASEGYTLPMAAGTPATLDNLRNIKGAGILYLSTHGGEGDGGFCITTVTRVTDATENDPIIQQDMADGLITYAGVTLEVRLGGLLDGKIEKVYAITHKFIERYMTFSENSLVYFDACSSDDFLVRTACHKQGASLFVGWTAPVKNYIAVRNAQFIFDRLLGVNKNDEEEDPVQRPFDHPSVLADLKRRGWNVSPGSEGYANAEMVFAPRPQSPEFGLLNPSIKYVDVKEEEKTLTLIGIFGHAQGKVTVDGAELAIRSWKPDEIVCTLPLTGAGSAGDVRVEVDGHKSNIRTLSEWKTVLHYEMTGPGSLKKQMEFRVRWRGDIGSYRENAGDEPRFREVYCDFTTDSTAGGSGSGTYSDSTAEYTWAGEMILPYFIGDNPIPDNSGGFIGNLTLKPERGVLELFLGGSGKGGGTTKIIPKGGGNTQNLDFTLYFPIVAFGPPIRLPMSQEGEIGGDSKKGATFAEPFVQFSARGEFSWDDIKPRFPPRDDTGRSR